MIKRKKVAKVITKHTKLMFVFIPTFFMEFSKLKQVVYL